jgi:hypothetical protein
MITNRESGTTIDEIADGIYRISTPMAAVPGGFTFNQYLVVDDEPLLFTPASAARSRWCARPSPPSCRSRGCATSRSRTTRQTSAGR